MSPRNLFIIKIKSFRQKIKCEFIFNYAKINVKSYMF